MRAAGVRTRAELELLPETEKQRLRATAFVDYYRSSPNLLAEGHFFLTEEDVRCFDALLLVDAPTLKIIEFRREDNTRNRSLDHKEIDKERREISQRVRDLEHNYGIKIKSIENTGTLDDLTEKVRKTYQNCIGKETHR